jgi:hypothetical protein
MKEDGNKLIEDRIIKGSLSTCPLFILHLISQNSVRPYGIKFEESRNGSELERDHHYRFWQ